MGQVVRYREHCTILLPRMMVEVDNISLLVIIFFGEFKMIHRFLMESLFNQD